LAKFLVVHPYLDVYGGGERVCHNVIESLVNHDQEVELLTFDFDPERYKQIVGDSIPKSVSIRSLGHRIKVEPPFTIYKRRNSFVKLLKAFRNDLKYDYLFSTQSSSPFEPVYLNKAKKNIAYVHFPEIHYAFSHGNFRRKAYLYLFKRWVDEGVKKLDVVFCNSNYTKQAIELYWKTPSRTPIVIYPPVNLESFWSEKPTELRTKRVIYVARFIPMKRHEIMKRLASDLPSYDFCSVGGLIEGEESWFNNFSKGLPSNYSLKTNVPGAELIYLLQDSRIYVHLMEGEHFGIAPVEALASGCITIVHDSGGMTEFIPNDFRWRTYEDLKEKIVGCMEKPEVRADWEMNRQELKEKISILGPENFQDNIWLNIKNLIVES